jgi:hypothetical protein
MATTSNAASVWVPATASIVPNLFLRGALALFLSDVNFDAAVAGATGTIIVRCDRIVLAPARYREARRSHAPGAQVIAGVCRAVDRQGIIERIAAGIVGMADDGHRGGRMLDQRVAEAIQNGPEIRFDIRAIGIKRDVAGDFQLQAIISRLADLDAGALGCLFHRPFLIFHAVRPDIADHGASRATQYGAACRAIPTAAARCTAEDGAEACADAGTRGRALLGRRHISAARDEQGESDCSDKGFTKTDKRSFFHGDSLFSMKLCGRRGRLKYLGRG